MIETSARHYAGCDRDALGIDRSRVALVGHSMGGWLALMSAATDTKVACVGALDARNVGAYGR